MKYLLLIAFLVIGKMNASAACPSTNGAYTTCVGAAGTGCSPAGACIDCGAGYAAVGDTGCQQCPGDNCASCAANTAGALVCDACNPGFALTGTFECIRSTGCLRTLGFDTSDTADLAAYTCAECMSNYFLDATTNVCMSCEDTDVGGSVGCSVCAPATASAGDAIVAGTNPLICSAAADGYYFDTASSAPVACASNCAMCSATACTQCDIGYVLLPVNDFVPTAQQGTCQNIGIVDDFFGSSAITSVVALASLVAFFRF